MPDIKLVDLKIERKEKTLLKDFSLELREAITHNLAHKEQTILFLNRRVMPLISTARSATGLVAVTNVRLH